MHMAKSHKQSNPFERLRDHYQQVDTKCPECGYEAADTDWKSTTDGSEVRYQRMCENCGYVHMRSVTLSN